jgi:hypothetical protein
MDQWELGILTGIFYAIACAVIIYGLRDFPRTMREIFAEDERGEKGRKAA